MIEHCIYSTLVQLLGSACLGILECCTACPVVDINPTVMQAYSRGWAVCIQGKLPLVTHEQANVWCMVRKHAM